MCTECNLGLPLCEPWVTDSHSHSVSPFLPSQLSCCSGIQAPRAVEPGRQLCCSSLHYKAAPQPPWLEAWNDLGVSSWACPTWHQSLPLPDPRAGAALLVWRSVPAGPALHCMTTECKAMEGRQRQQKACSISENTADRRKHPPEEEEVTQRQKF